MDLDFTPEQEEFRAEVRGWLAEHVPAVPLPQMDTPDGCRAHREWERTLHGAGLSVVHWPREFGGREASLVDWLVFEEEYHAAGAPERVNHNGITLLGATLFEYGTDEQRRRVLPAMARGDEIWAQAWSEPEAGSDLAGLRSSARPTEGGWLLSGQKIWSSRAVVADRAFGLFRSDPAAERHRGLSYLMFPLDAPGVTVRPIPRLDGAPIFAEIFLDEAFVPDEDLIGEPGAGWRIAMSTAANERGLFLRSPGRFSTTAERLVELWRETACPADAGRVTDEPAGPAVDGSGERVADTWIRARAYQLFAYENASKLETGGSLGAESSLNKVMWSELDLAAQETARELLGADGELLEGPWARGFAFALAGTIYAGTNEIQRDVIAERILGLPRGRR